MISFVRIVTCRYGSTGFKLKWFEARIEVQPIFMAVIVWWPVSGDFLINFQEFMGNGCVYIDHAVDLANKKVEIDIIQT